MAAPAFHHGAPFPPQATARARQRRPPGARALATAHERLVPARVRSAREHDGAVAVHEDAALCVESNSLSEDPSLDILAERDHVGSGVGVGYPRNVLLNDRPLVEVGRDVVGSCADELDAALVGLRVGARALEGGEEGVVDVYDAAPHAAADLVGEDLHVASQDDQLNIFGGDEVKELAFRLGLRVLRDRDIQEGHAVELGDGGEVGVVADDRDHIDGQALRLLAVQQVGQAVAFAGHHDDGAQLATQVIHPVGGTKFFGDARQALVDRRAPPRRIDLDAHEEGTGIRVTELLGLDDIATGLADHAGDGMHDTRTVRAGQGHDELRIFSHRCQSTQVRSRQRGRDIVCGRRHGRAGRQYPTPNIDSSEKAISARRSPIIVRMRIRSGTASDLDFIESAYAHARAFMRANGNATQWPDGYPSRADAQEDIRRGHCYIVADDDGPLGVFSYAPGPDPTYAQIDGSWRSDANYHVIHRVVSVRGRGVARAIFSYAAEGAHYLRCDTHEDNRPMRHALTAFGFRECGTITVVNGTTRIAYDWLAEDVRD